ncbi:MAG: TonB-dependent receptor [Chitinophagaceae bacterium]
MRKFFFITAVLFSLSIQARQPVSYTVNGYVADSVTQQPLGVVSLEIKSNVNRKQLAATLSATDGRFQLLQIPAGNHQLEVTLVGYHSKTVFLADTLFAGNNTINIGQIWLQPATTSMKEVVVTAIRPLIKQEIDRISYDVQADPDSKAQTVMELLRKVPLLSVDGDDNIQLQGSGSYRIFINGRPSALLVNSPKDALRAMPASSVQKIEVITTPPAKYDSEGLAGIINIVLNKRTDNGYNATITARNSIPFGPVLTGTGTFRQNKWGASASVSRSYRLKTDVHSSNYRQTYDPVSVFEQQNSNKIWGRSFFSNAELSFEADSLNLFTVSGYIGSGISRRTATLNSIFGNDEPNMGQQLYTITNDQRTPWQSGDLGFNYQRGFRNKTQQLLTFSYRYNAFVNNYSVLSRITDKTNYNSPDNDQYNRSSAKENTLQLDYVHPFGKATMETGVKIILRSNTSRATVYNWEQQEPVEDVRRANDFNYQQDVLGFYNSWSWKINAVTAKLGIRLEHTLVDADFKTTGTGINRQYTNFTPVLSLMRTLPGNQTITAGFSSRIERPGIWLLNPFVDKSNPQLISSGNPDLKAVQSYQGELGYTKTGKGTLNLRASYLYSGGTITNVVRILSDTLTQTTYENIGTNSILRLNITGNYPMGKFSVNFSTGAFYVWVKGPYNGRFFSNEGIRTNSFAALTYRPGGDWSLGANVGFNRRYITLQGSSDDFYYYSLSAGKSWFDKRLSLNLILGNFGKKNYSFKQYSSTPDFYQSNTENSIYRNFNFSLSYKFGKLAAGIKKNKRGISNDDVNNGGK